MNFKTTFLLAMLLLIGQLCYGATTKVTFALPHSTVAVSEDSSETANAAGQGEDVVVHYRPGRRVIWPAIVSISCVAAFLGVPAIAFGIAGLVGRDRKLKALSIAGIVLGAAEIVMTVIIIASLMSVTLAVM